MRKKVNPIPNLNLGSNEPLYNIGIVSRISGISMATLRAWERRYQFPGSQRTEGGHRLFSEQEIYRLKWVKARVEEGMQTAQAINALRYQEQTGSLKQLPESYLSNLYSSSSNQSHLDTLRNKLFDALQQRNTILADELLSEAIAIISPDEVILNVLAPLLTKIGEEWESGELTIAEEHFDTNYLRQKLMMWMLTGPSIIISQPILLACGPEEWHEGSLLILGAILRRRRYPVLYLGQNLPLKDLVEFVKKSKPALIILVSMTDISVKYLIDFPFVYPDIFRSEQTIVGYGGRIFIEQPEWRQKMQGVYLGSTINEGLETVEKLLKNRGNVITSEVDRSEQK